MKSQCLKVSYLTKSEGHLMFITEYNEPKESYLYFIVEEWKVKHKEKNVVRKEGFPRRKKRDDQTI